MPLGQSGALAICEWKVKKKPRGLGGGPGGASRPSIPGEPGDPGGPTGPGANVIKLFMAVIY